MIKKPQPNEYKSFYGAYINLPDDTDILQQLSAQKDNTYNFLTQLPEAKADHAYAEGKWSIKQVVGHMIDAERIFAYRILCFSRNEPNGLPGFDENAYVENSNFTQRTLADLAAEFKAVRESNLFMLRALTDEQSLIEGTANATPITIRALVYVIAGHELHHMRIIKDRYLS